VDERVADLFRRDRPRHLLVEVDVFSSVRPLPVVTPTPPMVPLPTTPSTANNAIIAPLAKEAATGGDVAGDPSSTPVKIFHRCVNIRICEQLCKKKINAKICERFQNLCRICVEKSQPKISRKKSPFFSMWRNGQLSRNLQ
jgi:hypothetical protein